MTETWRGGDPVPTETDPDFDLIRRLFTLHPPQDSRVMALMDDIRERYMALAYKIVSNVPRTPDRTIALRSLHRACMDTIAAVACNQ